MHSRIEFLGHIIEDGKIYPSFEVTKAVLNFSEAKSTKDFQSFVGLSGHFRKFIANHSIISKPLTDLLRNDRPFQFAEKEREAFEKLKSIIAGDPVLKIYNPKNETELHTDACQIGYGAVILQKSPDGLKLHLIYYISCKTTPAEQKYSSYELEVLAIIEALKTFCICLLGIHFRIVTDCAEFEKTMSKKELATRVARWALLLDEFDYIIERSPGTKMKHVDALSRHPVMMTTAVTNISPQIKKAQEEDDEIKLIMEILKNNAYKDYFLRDGTLYNSKDGRDVLVIQNSMQIDVI